MKNDFPIITTARCLLRQIQENDLENIFKGLSNTEVYKYYGVSYHSLVATKEQMKFYSDLEKNNTGIWWAVCSADNAVFYGAIGYNNLSKEHAKAEIGFWLLPEFWNKGIMSEIMPKVLHFGFEKLSLHRIEAFVETENTSSKSLLEKFDFLHEGTMKDCEIKNNQYISLDIYAKLNNEN